MYIQYVDLVGMYCTYPSMQSFLKTGVGRIVKTQDNNDNVSLTDPGSIFRIMADTNKALFYHMKTTCSGLPCPPYTPW